jgi:hypothetical protein
MVDPILTDIITVLKDLNDNPNEDEFLDFLTFCRETRHYSIEDIKKAINIIERGGV